MRLCLLLSCYYITSFSWAQLTIGGKTFVQAQKESGPKGEWVLYEKNAPQNEATRRWLTKQVLVELNGVDLATLRRQQGVSKVQQRGKYAVLTFDGAADAAIQGAVKVQQLQGVRMAEPMLARKLEPKLLPNDPLFAYNATAPGYQWHLKNTGQNGGTAGVDVNVSEVWDAYRGSGIRIGIVDDGLEVTHPDLAFNVDTLNDRDFNDLDNDPSPTATSFHGTACAGIAAAVGNNNLGVSGVAPESMLVGMRLIGQPTTDADEADSFLYRNDIIQVKSNSWGPTDNAYGSGGPGPLSIAALADATTNGRGGKGTVFIWAAGNGNANGDDSNFDGWAASPYAIAVGAVGDDGKSVWYGEPGANILVCAPSNGGEQSITTTDRMGTLGYNSSSSSSDYSSRDYTNTFGGTSAATPAVAGVVALMLQANPNLGYRDVQEILMLTATRNDPGSGGWIRNGAGYDFHHSYGSGLVNADAAVNAALTWTNLPTRQSHSISNTGINLPIPDGDSAGLTHTFTVPAVNSLRLEHVTVTVKTTHSYRGQLEWWLSSPSGVRTRLARSRANDTGADLEWTFMSTHLWGERSEGQWKLQVYDTNLDQVGTLDNATITFYGTAPTGGLPQPVITSQLTIVGRAGAVMQHQITASNFCTSFDAIGLPSGLSVNTSTGVISGLPTDTGAFYGYITATNATGTTQEAALFYILPADPALSLAVEQPVSLQMVPFGFANWSRQTSVTYDGVDAAQSPVINHDEYAGMEFTVTGPTRMSYWWKVSSEENFDYLVLAVDGSVRAFITGEVDWMQVSYDLGPGSHNVDIYYIKDQATVAAQDKGWIDQLVLTPITTPPVISDASVAAYVGASFRYQVTATNAPTSYNAIGLPTGLQISSSTGLIYGTPTALGTYDVTLEATNPFGTGTASLTFNVGTLEQGLAVAMDQPTQILSSSGSLSWLPQSLYTNDGSDAARSGPIGDLQDSEMSTQVTGPTKITFYWGVSSEANYDYLRFYIDGTEKEAISGEVGWTLRSYTIPAGVHTLKWAYIKDNFVRSGLDSGFVDQLQFYADVDQDGFWADEEAAFGTSDANPNQSPRPDLTPSVAGMTLQFSSIPGRLYHIQHSPDLQNWTTVPITATTSSSSWLDLSSSTASSRFYRVQAP
jgi:subtilisin-like proprotein convertase family protein